jgi:SP family myo-inositol transporter-like MFS transporter 13
MSSRDESDSSTPDAPLLAAESPARQHDSQASQIPEGNTEYSSGRFIWSLTFSAGISGLLFGYEYVGAHRSRGRIRLTPNQC